MKLGITQIVLGDSRCRSAGVEVTSVIASFAERGNLLSSDAAAMV